MACPDERGRPWKPSGEAYGARRAPVREPPAARPRGAARAPAAVMDAGGVQFSNLGE